MPSATRRTTMTPNTRTMTASAIRRRERVTVSRALREPSMAMLSDRAVMERVTSVSGRRAAIGRRRSGHRRRRETLHPVVQPHITPRQIGHRLALMGLDHDVAPDAGGDLSTERARGGGVVIAQPDAAHISGRIADEQRVAVAL